MISTLHRHKHAEIYSRLSQVIRREQVKGEQAMAETAITAVLSKFGELAASEAKLLAQVGDDMMLLRDRLEWLQAFIRDADRKRRSGTDGLTRVWVRQTRDVAFQVEDALDEFFHEVDLESQGYQGLIKWCKYLTGFWTQIIVRHGLSSRLKRIKSRLEQISENQKEYKIEHTSLAALTSSTTAIAAWRDDRASAIGLDEHVKTIEGMLFREDHPEPMFISIFGESGVGKSTLISVLGDKIHENFDLIFGYPVVPDSSTEDLLREIYRRIAEHCTEEEKANCGESREAIHTPGKIRRLLANKKYLMILSGISSKTMLNCVRASLPVGNTGSSVVLVLDSEYEEVAWHANSMNKDGVNKIHLLSRLDEKQSGQLFRSRAFRKQEYSESEHMGIYDRIMSHWRSFRKEESNEEGNTRMYDKIVYDITGGYPLAIVVLAGLLRFKEKPGQWEAVLQQLRPGPGTEEKQDSRGNQITEDVQGKCIEWQTGPATQANTSTTTTIERVFWASFEDLPNDLKSCFLYFAAFPKNIVQYASQMVQMWMAEGFIKPQKGKTMEELGHDYLKEMVLRCLVQIEDTNAAGGIEGVRVQRNLHGFLHSEAREAGFVEVHDMHDAFVPSSVRRLSFMSFGGRYTTLTNKFPKLRSFICRVEEEDEQSDDSQGVDMKHRWHDMRFLRGSKFMRLISLKGLRLNKLPDDIGCMVHLRYLRVDSKDLKDLPSSMKRLTNLQTLDIRGTQVEEIHISLWTMKTLRHVLADNLKLPPVQVFPIRKELDELQTVHGVKPHQGEWDQLNCPLLKMTKLRSLELQGLEDAKHGAALKAALGRMHLLGHLKLKGDEIPPCVFTEQGLQYLQTVELEGPVQWPPADAFNELRIPRPNLVQLSLTDTNDAPQDIQEELRKAGFNRSTSRLRTVYRLPYR
ncbi:unnamed protein product [Triticum turgidum subsp. durum]|uniref:Uncharacterized protein n=1 Tax=Triticum turgidum subsp. durum TaxID=4567 RepID=A0A9R1PYW1_TRITD|nr:unnamed protein product [Triticum turgidum subsp. durum]